MIFHGEDPSDYVREMVEKTNSGEFDDQLVYQKRLRRKLHEYQKNIPPQVRAARLADDINAKLGRPLQYQNRGRIEYLITVNGPEPHEYRNSPIDYQHYIDKQLKPIADAILPFIGTDFRAVICTTDGAVLNQIRNWKGANAVGVNQCGIRFSDIALLTNRQNRPITQPQSV